MAPGAGYVFVPFNQFWTLFFVLHLLDPAILAIHNVLYGMVDSQQYCTLLQRWILEQNVLNL